MSGKHSKPTTPPIQPPIDSNYSKPGTAGSVGLGQCADVIGVIGENVSSEDRANYGVTSSIHRDALFGTQDERTLKITRKLLSAVAYGMESKAVNINLQPKDLFAEDLLTKSPEFLLERGDIKDWGGRTFKNITAFEYALWAKDFKMLEMMFGCIPATAEGDRIRAGLLEQYEQVTAPIYAGGGLTYELTYDQPTMDANGIPMKDAVGVWQTTSVTEVHTENHFDVAPLLAAYQDYEDKFNAPGRTWPDRDACWVKIIGTLQRLLPIHILQRYCDPGTPFAPIPSFTGVFKRTTQFFNHFQNRAESLLSSSLSTDFSLWRAGGRVAVCAGGGIVVELAACRADLAAIRQVDEVSTNEIETKIKQQLTRPAQSQTPSRP